MPRALILTVVALSTVPSALINFQRCLELNANITRITRVEGTPFNCPQLSVPLDYTNPNSVPLVLDLFRATAPEGLVLGTFVLINFGGPGGTGAENLPAWAGEAQMNIGATVESLVLGSLKKQQHHALSM